MSKLNGPLEAASSVSATTPTPYESMYGPSKAFLCRDHSGRAPRYWRVSHRVAAGSAEHALREGAKARDLDSCRPRNASRQISLSKFSRCIELRWVDQHPLPT